MDSPSTFGEFVAAVERATGKPGKRQGRNVRLHCPAHDDQHPSLDVAEGDDQRPLVQCRSRGCSFEAICEAIGWQPQPRRDEPEATYDYVDEQGQLLYQVVRMAGKRFFQRKPVADGWDHRLGDTRRVLYRLPLVRSAIEQGHKVYVVEGEKDVHAAEAAGVVATCNPGGAGKWRSEYTEALEGAEVVVVQDRDEAGAQHARTVARELHAFVYSPAVGKDLTDHLRAGKSLDELIPIGNGRLALPWSMLVHMHAHEQETEWLWADLLAKDYLTLFAGPPKIGKSTFLFALLAALRTGYDFLGVPTRKVRAIYASEEGYRSFLAKAQVFGQPDFVHLFRMRPRTLTELCDELADDADFYDANLVVIDTWPQWAAFGEGGSNDADTIHEAMRHLQQLASNVAVLAVGFARKGGGDYGEGVAGSHRILASVDVCLEMKRISGQARARRLNVLGRTDAPERLEYELDENGTLQAFDAEAISQRLAEESVLEALKSTREPESGTALAELAEVRKATTLKILGELRDRGEVEQIGAGNKTRWRLSGSPVPSVPSI